MSAQFTDAHGRPWTVRPFLRIKRLQRCRVSRRRSVARGRGRARAVGSFTRRGSISPPREPSRVPRSFGRVHPVGVDPRALPASARPKHRGSPFGTRPLTAPAPGSDRRLSGEGHQVGGHRARSGHEQQRSVHGVRRRRPGARPGMHLRYERTHLHTRDLHGVRRQRGGEGLNVGSEPTQALRCVPESPSRHQQPTIAEG